MGSLASVQLDKALVADAQRRAEEEGVGLTAYISDLLRRALERQSGEDSVLVYDHGAGGKIEIDQTAGEDEAAYLRRSALYGKLLGPR